jgi:hypothetical protein
MGCAARLSPGTVQVVLDYLCPLTGPVPAHLLSRPLLQRHHFLALSPETPAEYLAWPSVQQSRAVQLLQSVPVPPPDPSTPVNYSADSPGDNLCAHVRITPDLRLVFLWDDSGWLYHNVALMPFPADSDPSFERAYAIYAPDDFLPEPAYNITVTEEDDDSYWDSYGGGDDDADRAPVSSNKFDPNPNSEDAYWAQYSAVQGMSLSQPLQSFIDHLNQALETPLYPRHVQKGTLNTQMVKTNHRNA